MRKNIYTDSAHGDGCRQPARPQGGRLEEAMEA